MIHTDAAGAACRSAAMAGSAVLAIAVSSVASATASMIAAIARRLAADMGASAGKGGADAALSLSDKAWLVGCACRRGRNLDMRRASGKVVHNARRGLVGRSPRPPRGECSDCYRAREILQRRRAL